MRNVLLVLSTIALVAATLTYSGGRSDADVRCRSDVNGDGAVTDADYQLFLAPVRHFGTDPGEPGFDAAFDIFPGAGPFDDTINIQDFIRAILDRGAICATPAPSPTVAPIAPRFLKKMDSGFDSWATSTVGRNHANAHYDLALGYPPHSDPYDGWYTGLIFDYFDMLREQPPVSGQFRLFAMSNGAVCNYGGTWGNSGVPIHDPGSPTFRQAAYSYLTSKTQYQGHYLDDVNLAITTVNCNGGYCNGTDARCPRDPRTNQRMTQDAWEGYMGGFLEGARVLGKPIICNTQPWHSDEGIPLGDPGQDRAQAACDYVEIEHGIGNCAANQAAVDGMHANGANVLWQAYIHDFGTITPAQLSAALACFEGSYESGDVFSTFVNSDPNDWDDRWD